jgi:hypothetical protein
MAGSKDEKDALVKTPLGADQQTTPLGSSEPLKAAADQGLAEPALRAVRERYDLLAEVGRGGMGIVYKARDRETDEIVALKVLKPEVAARPEVIERFKAELRLARKITHKNVCRTYELLRFDDTVVIAMEYVEGESLRAILSRYGSVPFRRGLVWAEQICAALAEAHAQGIIHRDLKPENILIDRQGQAKVMDFGIARSLETDATMTGTLVGTPAYMSPEQAEGKPPDPRSDIYALGLVLYEMFVGQHAFTAETPVGFILMQIKESPPPPRSVEPYLPSFLDRAIEKCLEKNPQKRFQSVAELQAAVTEKEILEPKVAQLQLPPHLLHARRSDFLLLLFGALGLAGYIALAEQVIPEMGLRVRLTREMLFEKAREEMTRRGWKPYPNAWLSVETDRAPYNFLAERVGYAQARASLSREFPPYLFQIRYSEAVTVSMFESEAAIMFEPDGSIRSLELPVVHWVPTGEGLPRQQALDLARQAIQQTFGVDTSQLAVENEAPLVAEGRHGITFRWVKREPSKIEWHYQADVYDRITLLKRSNTLPEDYRARRNSLHSIIVMVLWSVLALVLFLARRLYSQVRAREIGVFATLALAAAVGLMAGAPFPAYFFYVLVIPLYAVAMALWLVVLTPAVTYLANRPWPYMTSSYTALIQLRPAARVTGLAIVRGISCGLLLLGLYAVLLRLGMFAHLTRPVLSPTYSLQVGSFLPLLTSLAIALVSAGSTAYSLGFFVSLFRRWTSSLILLAIVGGAVAIGLEDFSLPLDWFAVFLSLAAGAAFSCVLVTFDLLTLLAAGFTFYVWQHNLALVQMFEAVGSWQYWFLLVLWAAIFVWSLFAGFRPTWDRLGRRLAEMFE